MSKPFSVTFKQKMVERLTGRNAMSARQLAIETGVAQQSLSRWLQEALSLPVMADKPKPAVREWTVEHKARVLERRLVQAWLRQLAVLLRRIVRTHDLIGSDTHLSLRRGR
jgi:transposase